MASWVLLRVRSLVLPRNMSMMLDFPTPPGPWNRNMSSLWSIYPSRNAASRIWSVGSVKQGNCVNYMTTSQKHYAKIIVWGPNLKNNPRGKRIVLCIKVHVNVFNLHRYMSYQQAQYTRILVHVYIYMLLCNSQGSIHKIRLYYEVQYIDVKVCTVIF